MSLLKRPSPSIANFPCTALRQVDNLALPLDIDNFIEIVFTNALQSRVGVWLNPSLGNVTLTAFDSMGQSLESFQGTAGNFIGFDRPSADIKFVSIVGGTSGFTVDDLTYAGASAPPAIPEPGTITCVGLGLLGLVRQARRRSGRGVS